MDGPAVTVSCGCGLGLRSQITRSISRSNRNMRNDEFSTCGIGDTRVLSRETARVSRNVVLPILLLAFLAAGTAHGQSKRRHRTAEASSSNPVAESKADLVKKAKEHKANLEAVAALLDVQVKKATAEFDKKKELFDQGIVARRELEAAQQTLDLARNQLGAQQSEIAQTDSLIAEASAAEQMAKLAPMRMGGFVSTAVLIRYYGPAPWSPADIGKVESFFTEHFGRALPISAFGQTPVHDRLGFDHHGAVDVAVHPDSSEGRALISYLQSAGISFIAFREAVPGSATGAHIHVGLPSRRIAR